MDLLDGLNPQQREAVVWGHGPALVLAGPGSGKTRVLTHRVAYLVREVGVGARNVLAVTFTNKAAREMKERLVRLLGAECEALTIGTFHATCARILRREGALLGYSPNYTIYDEDDQQAVMKRVIKELNLDEKVYRPGAVLSIISRAKNDLIGPDAWTPRSYREEIIGRIYRRYQQALRESNAMDFDDLLTNTVLLWQEHPDVLERYRLRYSHVLVDEFQDTNAAQYVLLRLLAGQHRNLFVVADEDQSIYSWRGADFRNIQRFRKDFPEAPTILLERNYRSMQTILDVANAVISRNVQRTPKRLVTDRGKGGVVILHEVYDEQEEGQYVVAEIQRLIGEGVQPGECAIMYRTNAQSRAVEEAFVRAGMRYKLVGATRFYQRREIKDVLAYLRIVYNPADSASLNRIINVPPRGLGAQTVAALFAWAGEQGVSVWDALHMLREADQGGDIAHPIASRAVKPLLSFLALWEGLVEDSKGLGAASILNLILERTNYRAYLDDGTEEGRDRWDNVMELLNVASQYEDMENSLGVFLQEVALVADVDELEEQPNVPVLLTLHMAKGLEFPVVFILGLEEGILPHVRSSDSPEELEEERRLFYVGITRAKDRLYLLRAFRRATYGRSAVAERSQFLRDIPRELVSSKRRTWPSRPSVSVSAFRDQPAAQAPRREEERPARPSATTFAPGERVSHPVFGEGTVVKSELLADDEQVTVDFPAKGVKTLLARFAKLQKVR
ncbi:MAG: UvrD-helicase domain-containing protein [Anaerolineales bacterium]